MNRRRKLGLETLESRLPLDGAGLTLTGDTYTLNENGPQVALDVLANDVFADDYAGARRVTSVSFGSEGGRIEIAPDGAGLLYTPPADYAGIETFQYAVDGAATATVRVTIAAALADDQFDVLPTGETVALDVLANDPFWQDYTGPRQITSVSVGSAGGLVEIAADGQSINYAAPVDAITRESFIYVVDELYAARVRIDIPSPLKADQYELVQHDPTTELDVLANDPFWEGYAGERRITHVVPGPLEAEVEIAPDGQSLLYTTLADFPSVNSEDYLTYVVDGVYEQRVRLIIYRPIVDDSFTVDQNSTDFEYNVTQNDKYYSREARAYRDVIDVVTAVTQPENGGSVSISSDGQGVVYTPAPGFLGVDTFTYTADGVHEATVRVNVTSPVRDDNLLNIYQDTPNQSLPVLANDFLGNGYAGPRQITSVGLTASGGVLTIGPDGASLLYTPPVGYTGHESFTYTVDDDLTANVSFHVYSLALNEYHPSVRHYQLGQSFTFNVLANDHFHRGYQGPGEVTSVELVSGVAEFTFDATGRVTLIPRAAGGVTVRYTVDGVYEATHTLLVSSQTASDLVAVGQNSADNPIGVLANDFRRWNHSYSGPRQVTGVTQSARGGTVTIGENGRTVVYTPPEDFHGRATFTYTVDDFWTETVQVEVIRRVRDDQFRVDAGDGPQRLPVLVNDLFGANYAGVGEITAVTAASGGGVVTIAADGGSLTYTPAPGFTGTDTFTYTVDGALKAEVSVIVDTPAEEQFPTFASADDYFDFLLADALERYASRFGAPAWNYPSWLRTSSTNFAAGPDPSADSAGDRSHSETNVQVAGVDEGDIVEFDADYAYVLTDEGVTIVDAWPAEELSIASQIDIEGRTIAEFLNGDRLTVISETGGYLAYPWSSGGDIALTSSFVSADVAPNSFWPYWPPYDPAPAETIVTVIDVSDRAAPAIVQTTTMEGRYVDSRSVDGQVYTLVGNQQAVADGPQIIDEDNDPTTTNRYETVEEYTARVTANRGAAIEEALPSYTTTGPDGEVVRTGLLNTPETVHQPITAGADTLISIVSIDSESNAPGLTDTAAVYSTGASTIYASLESFYVFDADYSTEDGAITRIVKFDWDPASGGVDFAATTTVAGTIINQFSADEFSHETGHVLRIATTANNSRSGNWSGRDENLLFVLREDDGVLEAVSSIQNWALNEDIRSVRFLGDRAFVTTFRNVDPLFALDLSDVDNPVAVGHITLPGFTSYMHLVDENHLLTVGTNTPTGFGGPTQVSLFDISDLTQPLRTAEYTFSRFTTSEAQVDHHAFGYFAEHGLLAMPVASTFIERVDTDGDGYSETRQWVRTDRLAVFTVDALAATPAERLQLSTEIEHDAPVRRSGYIADKLYSIGADAVKVVDVDDLGILVGEVDLPRNEETTPSDYSHSTIVINWSAELLDSAVSLLDVPDTRSFRTQPDPAPPRAPYAAGLAAARRDLAERLGVGPEAPLLVTSEQTPDAPGGGRTVAFEVDGVDYFYRVGGQGRFEVAPAGSGWATEETAWNELQTPHVARPDVAVGDFNRDGVVDMLDNQTWRAAYGEWSLTAYLDADANFDGVVDATDQALWRENFRRPQPEDDADAKRPTPSPRELALAGWRPPVKSVSRTTAARAQGDTQQAAAASLSNAAPLLLADSESGHHRSEQEVIGTSQPSQGAPNAAESDAAERGLRLRPSVRAALPTVGQ